MTLQMYLIGVVVTAFIVMFVFGMIDPYSEGYAFGISLICAFLWPFVSIFATLGFIIFLIFEVPFMIGRKLGNSEKIL